MKKWCLANVRFSWLELCSLADLRWTYFLLLVFSYASLVTPAVSAEKPPNIIFIMADDLGYGDLGSYGQSVIQTPRLDELAREGMRFTQFYAGSTVCAPSRCVLMTGLHTGRCFIRGNGKDNLRPDDLTVAEVLQQAGYHTGLVGKWGLGHEKSTGLPTRKGFDYFFGYLDQHHAHNFYPSFLVRNEERVSLPNVVPNEGRWGQGVAEQKRVYSHDLIAAEALQFVEENQEGPFFLYLALTIPHANNEAGKLGMEVPDLGSYAEMDWPEPQKGHAAMITRMDRDIGKLLDKLKELEIDRETIVFFTSDNGPHREGGNDPDFHNSNGALRGIKRSLFEGGIRVPLLVRWPGHLTQGAETDWIGGFQDVLPTLAELAGGEDRITKEIDGISFVPALKQEPSPVDHDHLYWAFYEGGGAQAIREGKWKAIQQPFRTSIRLYDLSQDIGETTDLADQLPEVVERLKQKMSSEYQASDRWRFPKPKGSPDRRESSGSSNDRKRS